MPPSEQGYRHHQAVPRLAYGGWSVGKELALDFVATQSVGTLDRTDYAAGVLAFMRVQSETTLPF